MGAEYIDYIIADPIVIPENSKQYYCEKIVYLPNSYQINSKRSISEKAFTRAELGLPPLGFVFCCFNSNYKITTHVLDCWIRILKKVEDSVLWLFESDAKAASNLRQRVLTTGVNPERLIFAKRVPLLGEHLARYRSADLFLDTLPYNAHATGSDALWAGLPVLTCLGETFAGRVAASLLSAMDLPELITTTPEAYEALAIELATHPDRLKAIKQKLAKNRLTAPLFDTELFTKHIQTAYIAMYECYHAGLAPADIYVPNS
jgi:predicted O-linked N-acetylglucosamine transferase (SPINDLY family)